MRCLEGKPFIATGGGSGIGAAAALRLVEEGVKVVAMVRHPARTWRAQNIRCIAIFPGKMLGESGRTMVPKLVEGFNQTIFAKMCLLRLTKPDDAWLRRFAFCSPMKRGGLLGRYLGRWRLDAA